MQINAPLSEITEEESKISSHVSSAGYNIDDPVNKITEMLRMSQTHRSVHSTKHSERSKWTRSTQKQGNSSRYSDRMILSSRSSELIKNAKKKVRLVQMEKRHIVIDQRR